MVQSRIAHSKLQEFNPDGDGIGTASGEVGGVAGGFGGIGGLGGVGGIGGLDGEGEGGDGDGPGGEGGEGAMQELRQPVRHCKVGVLRQLVAHFTKHWMSKSTACAWLEVSNMAITAIMITIKQETLVSSIFAGFNLIISVWFKSDILIWICVSFL